MIKSGDYEVRVTRIREGNEPNSLIVTLEQVEVDLEATKFCIFHAQTKTYTVIGAKNIHHAANKAAKLWGAAWTGISRKLPDKLSWKFLAVRKFGEIVKQGL
jgi:hypothetical protein